ncbi:MAG: PleD family two-component system response regulator [Elusimicrobiota bacterium]
MAKKRILAVDDDASVCEFYEHALKLMGYDVQIAASARSAKESIALLRPDLILMDIMMPEQDGISFTRELRADRKTSDIPIVMVSGLADAGTLQDALLFGAVGYLVKPVEPDALKAKIDSTLTAIEHRNKKSA